MINEAKERESFESWMPSNYYVGFDYDNTTFQRKRNGCYICDYVEEAWSIWLARARVAADDAEKWLPMTHPDIEQYKGTRKRFLVCMSDETQETAYFVGTTKGSGTLVLGGRFIYDYTAKPIAWRALPPPPAAAQAEEHTP